MLALLLLLYILYLWRFRFAVGMLPVWIGLFALSILFSFRISHDYLLGLGWFRVLFNTGVIVFIIVEAMIVYAGFSTTVEEESDYIIVLGASVKEETMSLTLYHRVKKAYEYLQVHEDAKAVLSGGQGPGEAITEAEAMRRYLVRKGIDESRLILEEQSTSTKENVEFSYELINKDTGAAGADDQRIIIISSHFHILRGQIIGMKQGYALKGIGASTFMLLAPNYYLREFFGLFLELVR